MELSEIDGSSYRSLICGGVAALERDRVRINDLNVFPIPDGDTGDNMYMTIRAGAAAADGDSLAAVAASVAQGALLGARGNSGVILSRILAGVAAGFADAERADAATVAGALEEGVRQAYGAVAKPVEGTVLTVYREATEAAAAALRAGKTPQEGLAIMREAAARSLEHTPEQLAVLREAGVVDSGGAGLVSILDGMLGALDGDTAAVLPAADTLAGNENVDLSLFTEDSVLEYGYCTEFLLRLQRCKGDPAAFDEAAFTAHLNEIGDSVVAFRDGTVVKVHVHTRYPAEILAYAQKFGEFLTLKIENMTLQHNGVRENAASRPAKPHKRYAVVAVAAGQGIRETFLSMGADAVVDGGQSMNPATEDFIRAFESVNADTVFVFPGNGNILLTAEQAGKLYTDATVRVIPCRSIGETYAALSVLDLSSGDTEQIVAGATAAIGEAVSGGVSQANRDTEMNGIRVQNGDYIGFSDGTVLSDGATAGDALLGLAAALDAGRYGILLLICGQAVTAEAAQEAYRRLSETYRRTEVIMLDGGQPIHDYILMLE